MQIHDYSSPAGNTISWTYVSGKMNILFLKIYSSISSFFPMISLYLNRNRKFKHQSIECISTDEFVLYIILCIIFVFAITMFILKATFLTWYYQYGLCICHPQNKQKNHSAIHISQRVHIPSVYPIVKLVQVMWQNNK